MRADTVEQFKILKFIEARFEINYITIQKISNNTIGITDLNGESMNFKWDSKQNKIIFQEGE